MESYSNVPLKTRFDQLCFRTGKKLRIRTALANTHNPQSERQLSLPTFLDEPGHALVALTQANTISVHRFSAAVTFSLDLTFLAGLGEFEVG